MNLSKIREIVQAKTGFPERGATGTARLNSLINHALNQLHGDMPEVLLREEFRFDFEVPIDSGTLTVLPTDTLVMLNGPHNPGSAGASYFSEDYPGSGTYTRYRGRNIDIVDGNNIHHTFKIQDIDRYVVGAGGGPAIYGSAGQVTWRIFLNRPWFNTTDTNLNYKVYTYEYPYPADTIRVRSVIIDPEGRASDVQFSSFPDAMASRKMMNGWKQKGTPLVSARGDFFQLEPPHYAPVVSLSTETADPGGFKNYEYQWGYSGSWVHPASSTLAEEVTYGPAGSYSYIVAHVWGRRRPCGHYSEGHTNEGDLLPFYISGHSKASATASTTWGGPAIKVTTPDIDYVYGYSPDNTKASYHHNGIEKWIFRARHTEDYTKFWSGSSGTVHGPVEADGVYYLWKITPGYTTEVWDRGDEDPVDRRFQLIDSFGHYHIRFDALPTETDEVLLSIIRRPHELNYDTDVPRIPPEATDALIALVCRYVAGERDGSVERVSMYKALYEQELKKLRSIVALDSHVKSSFGDGLNTRYRTHFIPGPIKGW